MDIKSILVPVNGTSVDDEALRLACNIGKRPKGRVFIIYVIEVKRTLPLDAHIESELQKGEAVLAHAEQVAEDAGCEVEVELLQAREVGPAVVDEAVERGVDLIIIGLASKQRFGEFHMGSTAPYVLKNAPCRVWICREASVPLRDSDRY
jgi:nucleotide-binding universal stress UspA family protein